MLLVQFLGELVTDGDSGVGMELVGVWCVVLEVRKERGSKDKGSVTFLVFCSVFLPFSVIFFYSVLLWVCDRKGRGGRF